jgi:hypothetical protein
MSKPLLSKAAVDRHVARLEIFAEHHSPHLTWMLPILGQLVWDYADPGSIATRSGEQRQGRIVFFEVRGRRYVFSYLPRKKHIQLRYRTLQGKRVKKLTGNESEKHLGRLFEQLVDLELIPA